jgi:molybdopterin molybdotransferase
LLGLAAASNNPRLQVARRPSLGILATGDELVRPGAPAGADQIYLSNSYAIGHLAGQAGARISDFGIAADKRDDLARALGTAVDQGIDVLVTIGGVSVGDHDLVGPTLAALGFDLAFWRIAMRPGKPLMFGRLRQAHVVGLPGNPVSSYVCALLFLVPLLRALQGDPKAGEDPTFPARLGADMEENDNREDYIRAELSRTEEGSLVATPYSRQDSSMTRVLAKSQVLIVRPPYAAAAKAGDACRVVLLPA